ncbi:MAG: hypothetical protein ABI967_06445 [bacterium]
MKTLSRRWRLIALVPFAAVAILSIGSRIGAVADQTRQIREAADEVGFIIQGGITQGQVLRFDVARLASGHPGGVNLELKVFDSQGNLVGSNTYVFPPNQNNAPIQSSFFDLNAAQLPASAFDNTGRAQLNGIVQALPGSGPHVAPDNCGFVAAGEIFNFGDANRQTLVHIEGEPLSRCRRDD